MPRVSVILTSYNHQKYIREAIESVLAQTFNDFELIIWDDASIDNSWEIINSFCDPRIRAFSNNERRRGIFGINKAISEIATAEYIAIHHSDDVWEADKLAKQVAFLDEHHEIGAVFTNALAIGEDSRPLEDPSHFYSNIFDQPNRTRHDWLNLFFNRGNALCHPSVLIRRECYDRCGLYRFGLAQATDFDMWIRLCMKYEIYVLPEKLVRFRVRANEANASGSRPDSRRRIATELYMLMKNYLKIDSFEELVAVFPEAKKYYRPNGCDLKYVLAMVALEKRPHPFVELFGLELLFELLADRDRTDTIKTMYNFDYRDLIDLTGLHDGFSVETIFTLYQSIASKDREIGTLNQAITKGDSPISVLSQIVAMRDARIAALNGAVGERDAQITAFNGAVRERDARITAFNEDVRERDARITAFNGDVRERDARITAFNRDVRERDAQITALNEAVRERDARITAFNEAVRERDARIIAFNGAVRERDARITAFNGDVRERDALITALHGVVRERDALITALHGVVRERDVLITALHEVVRERDVQITALHGAIAERDRQMVELNRTVDEQKVLMSAMTSSRSWRITRPFRFAGKILRGDCKAVKESLAWHANNCSNQNPADCSADQKNKTLLVDPVQSAVQSLSCSEQPGAARKRILLVSYYCPTRAHAGGLRILDIYSLIKSEFPAIGLDLYTYRRPEMDWSYEEVERIFDNIYYAATEELSLMGLLNQCKDNPWYDVIDLQFHLSAMHIDEFRALGAKILFTPMESLARSFVIAVKEALCHAQGISLRDIGAGVRNAIQEIKFCLKADEVICVSRPDATFLRSVSCSRNIKYLESGISGIEFKDVLSEHALQPTPRNKENIIVYIAFFGSETNILAMKWYLDKVHPLIKKQVPDYMLHVVGRGDLSVFAGYKDEAVIFVGAVPSIGPYIDEAKVGIAPALGGAGLRGKMSQYAIYGVPSVVSPIAAKGLAYEDGVDIYITDIPEIFAKRCVKLLTDAETNERIGDRARQTALRNYTWKSKMDIIRKTYVLDGSV